MQSTNIHGAKMMNRTNPANLFSALAALGPEPEAEPYVEDVPITHVQVDALVALKIIKHAKDQAPTAVTGALLGMDIDGTLEVTQCYPYLAKQRRNQNQPEPEEDQAELDEMYQFEMLKRLRQVNADANTVGWYHSSPLSNFLHHTWIATQSDFQATITNSVVLEYDPLASQTGALSLRAFRLTEAFIKLYKGKPRSSITSDAVTRAGLLDEGLLEELPVSIRNSHLVSALLYAHNLTAHTVAAPMPGVDRASYTAKHAEALLNTLENYSTEQTRYSGWNRVYQREKARIELLTNRKRQENPDEADEMKKAMSAKLPNEPPKLDSLLIGHQIDQHAAVVEGFLAPAVLSVELAKAAVVKEEVVSGSDAVDEVDA
ncbi:hypothetical protein BCR44DRAFT_42845 [Catenaria anguillulae PL171]|uniref:MPN domain-containing protein n=1 Tax=Catenaria anguillulae PL171 TaxID=765915 RepID=A0A1Y2HP54_9FUNG|nr:hypothetical protein BCR44DRAFT_42845 [Catenaria anguillulae PL171]